MSDLQWSFWISLKEECGGVGVIVSAADLIAAIEEANRRAGENERLLDYDTGDVQVFFTRTSPFQVDNLLSVECRPCSEVHDRVIDESFDDFIIDLGAFTAEHRGCGS